MKINECYRHIKKALVLFALSFTSANFHCNMKVKLFHMSCFIESRRPSAHVPIRDPPIRQTLFIPPSSDMTLISTSSCLSHLCVCV